VLELVARPSERPRPIRADRRGLTALRRNAQTSAGERDAREQHPLDNLIPRETARRQPARMPHGSCLLRRAAQTRKQAQEFVRLSGFENQRVLAGSASPSARVARPPAREYASGPSNEST